MRAIGRIALLLLIVVPSLFGVQRIWSSLHWNELAALLSGRIENALPSTSYLAVDDQWLEFGLSGLVRAIRVRSNAVVAADATAPPPEEWWYAFEYQLIDAGGGVLRQGVYHHRTRLTRRHESGSGHPTGRNFLLDPTLNPTDGRSMVLHFEPETPPAGLRIRPIHKDPGLQAVMFRVYEKLPNPKHQLGYLWQRLGERKKERLAQSSVYGQDFLLEQEKRNLLRHEWKATGPLGVEDEQYRQMKLYITREADGAEPPENLIPYGLYCDQLVRGMIPIPEGEWRITLDVEPLVAETSRGQAIAIRWYGKGITQRWQTRLPLAPGSHPLGRELSGGVLEVVTSAPLVLRAWGSNGNTRLELTPQQVRLRSYMSDAAGSFSIDVDHVAGQPTPFRIDIRSRLAPDEDTLSRNLSYEMLDGDGSQLQMGRLAALLALSRYDRLSDGEPGSRLSEPVRYYFELPPEVARIRFSSEQELLLTAYTRPPALARKVRVPEDYQQADLDTARQPAWFLRRPEEEERLRRELRSPLLIVQPRPPETDPRLATGDYDWQLYQPTGNWRARYLLVPRREETPVRDQSLAAVYRELASGRPVTLRFRHLPGRREVTPTLLYLRDRSSPLEVRVMLGERLLSATQIAGQQGELQLPAVKPGTGTLAVVSQEPARWFVNQAEAEGASYLRRLAMQLTGGGLEFEYIKQSDQSEVLSAELYTRAAVRCGLRVTISGDVPSAPGPLREWTFRDRLFDLRQEGDQPIPVLNAGMRPLHGGQRFVIPLGADLPPGRYRIRFTLEGAPEGYLSLYRLTPGQTEQRTFFQEPVYARRVEP